MRRSVMLIVALLLVIGFIYADTEQPIKMLREVSENAIYTITRTSYPNVPDFNFDVTPINIMASWYDYFPGSYQSVPIRVQPSPAGIHPGGGIYVIFQAIPSAGAIRRVYYAYIQDGEVTMGPSLIDLSATSAEGFAGVDIDPETGDPFVSWHVTNPQNPDYLHCPLTFDQYSLIGTPGLWNTPFSVIRNPYDIGPEVDQEFIWPDVYVGPSPNPDQRRVYVIARNRTSNLSGVPCENAMIAFADFTTPTDLSLFDPDQWTYVTVPQLDDWRLEDIRPFRSNIVSRNDGRVGIMGHTSDLDDDAPPYGPNEFLFLLENENYGEGEWTAYFGDPTIPIVNPDDYFIGDSNQPYEDMRYSPYVNRHNLVIDDEGNYHFIAVFSLSTEENTWYPYFTTTKHIKFDRDTEEFLINDIYPRHEDPDSLYLPWSLPPEYEGDNIITNASYPLYWWDTEDFFHENYHRLIHDGSKMVLLFQESVKARLFLHAGDDQYAAWANVPETYIMISGDYGEHWSEPIVLNSIETPELEGMVPVYWYMSDHMEHLFDDWYRIHLFFLDDNDYGSYVQANGPNTGGSLMYTSIDIDFSDVPLNIDDQIVKVPDRMLKQNYPNPFNPSTTINFSIPSATHVRLNIYNLKGQLVRTLIDEERSEGEHNTVWNGEDENGRSVGSGVYFYRLDAGNESEVRKMLLVK